MSAAVDGSGAAGAVRLVTLGAATTPVGGPPTFRFTVLMSKFPGPRAVFVGRASLTKIGSEEKSLKSAWKDTAPPAKGGKRAGAKMLTSMACTAVKVMSIAPPVPKSVG